MGETGMVGGDRLEFGLCARNIQIGKTRFSNITCREYSSIRWLTFIRINSDWKYNDELLTVLKSYTPFGDKDSLEVRFTKENFYHSVNAKQAISIIEGNVEV